MSAYNDILEEVVSKNRKGYSDEDRKAILALANDPEISGIENEKEQDAAFARALRERGLDKVSETVEGKAYSAISPVGEDFDVGMYATPDAIAKALKFSSVEEMMEGREGAGGKKYGWWSVAPDAWEKTFGKQAPTIKDFVKKYSLEYMNNVEIPREKKNSLEDADMNYYGLFTAKDPLPGFTKGFAEFIFPRVGEAIERGEDPSWKDWTIDAAEKGLYAVPGAGWAKAGSTAAKAAPVIGKAVAKKAAEKAAEEVAKEGAKKTTGELLKRIGTDIAENAVIPTTTETLDALAYGDESPRGDFNIGDAYRGTLVNFATPRMFGMLGKRMDRSMEQAARGVDQMASAEPSAVSELVRRGSNRLANPTTKAGQAAQSFVINALGQNKYADSFSNQVPILGKVQQGLDYFGNDNDEEAKKQKDDTRKRSSVGSALKMAGLSDMDKHFLQKVEENPDVINFPAKLGKEANSFSLWLLTSEIGNELLRQYRPTYLYEEKKEKKQ